MSYLYHLDMSNRNKEQEERVEKAKDNKFGNNKVGKELPKRLSNKS